MPVSIVANLSSQYAQHAIRVRNDNVTAGTQRLSSGLRVFASSEDPAAVAVGTALRIENASLSKAQINAAGGVSMLQIADGALSQIGDIAIRMKALATQASSGQLADPERASIDLEYQALKSEIDRIAGDTEFNGVRLLAGTAAFDIIGAHAYSVDGITNLVFDQTLVTDDAAFRYSYNSTTEEFTLTRVDGVVAGSQTFDLTGLLDNVAGNNQNLSAGQSLTLHFSGLGVSLTLGSAFDRTADILPVVDIGNVHADTTFTPAAPVFTPNIAGISLVGIEALSDLGGAYSAATGLLAFDLSSDGAAVTLGGIVGLSYSVNGGAPLADGADTGNLVGAGTYIDIYTTEGNELVGRLALGDVATSGAGAGTLTVPVGQGLVGADFTGQAGATTLTYMVGSGVIVGQDLIEVRVPAVTVSALGLTTSEVTTQSNANAAITTLDSVLTLINQSRAQLGAQQARMEFVARNLTVITENNTSARSALMDADVPTEITNLTNDQAMLEVGISMLSQSNRLPQILLELLRS